MMKTNRRARRSLPAVLVSSALLGVLAVAGPQPADAADGDPTAMLLADVNPGPFDSSPSRFVELGDKVLFVATDAAAGMEWRKTDGTSGGTTLVKDIRPGTSGAFLSAPGFGVAGGNVFFPANDGSGIGIELWKTDGTEAGTVLVNDIARGTDSGLTLSTPFAAVGNTIFFTATDGVTGRELWMSDGTWEGTVMVKDIAPGAANSSPAHLTTVGSTVVFQASDGVTAPGHGPELWKSDGTEAGTVMVKDIAPGAPGSGPEHFAVLGSTVYFTAFGPGGNELWKSDGTEAGTVIVKDIAAGSTASNPGQPVVVGPHLYFSATHPTYGAELWKSDGTDAGTVLTKDINPGTNSGVAANLVNLTAFGSSVLFQANDGSTGGELWQSDGTEAGTTLVKDIRSGSGNGAPSGFAVSGPVAYFSATDGTAAPASGTELWRSDGTAAGTFLVKDINPGPGSSAPVSLTSALGTVFFAAGDVSASINHGREPWRVRNNFAPVAGADTYSTSVDSPRTVAAPGVLGNDTDADGDTLTAGSASSPAHGTVSLNADGSFTYTPAAGYSGPDSFTYVVIDGIGGSATGTVSFTVGGTNAAPVAVADNYATDEDTPITVAAPGVVGNDTDGNGDTLSAGSASTPAHGSVTLNADGSFAYTPAANYNGSDGFTYVVSDGQGGTATGTVSITVAAVNDAPVAASDSYTTNTDVALTVPVPGVLGNDSDLEGGTLSAGSASTPANGTVTLNADGSFTYVPAAGFFGVDTFTYVASDDTGGTATTLVAVNVFGEGSVTSVRGSACGYSTTIGLFHGPQQSNGCARPVPPTDSTYSPYVELPATGSPSTLTAADPDGATAYLGPGPVYGGRWPVDVNNAPPSGPTSVSTHGSPAEGFVTSSADIGLNDPVEFVQCYGEPAGTANCVSPGGFGPSPVEGDSLHVECTASEDGVTGSTTLVNADMAQATTEQGEPIDIVPVPNDPAVNYELHGEISVVNDFFTTVYNEQVWNADGSLTVTAAHIYLYGPTAVGEVIKGQVTCGTNPHPVTPPDTDPPTCRPAIPYYDRLPAGLETSGVFDTGGLQSITNVQVTNGQVKIGANSGSPFPYLRFVPGQTGPLFLQADRSDASMPMYWSFDATDMAGNTAHCVGFDAPPVPAVTASPSSVTAGNTVTATWSNLASPTPTDWVGLYPTGSTPDPGLVAWAYTNGSAAGSLSLTVPANSPPGTTYELRLFTNNSYERLATSAPFSVVASSVAVSASPTSVNPGAPVTATYTGISAPTGTDWVGLYDSSSAPEPALLAWAYTNGAAAGSVQLFVPPNASLGGTYELRLFTANSYTRLATSAPFTVAASTATIAASPATVAPGAPVTATYADIGAPTATDWVGLYDSSSASNPALLAWAYTNGSAAGSVQLFVPSGAALGNTYELRLFSSNSYTRLATSAPFSVALSNAAISASPSSVPAGSSVTATWSGIAAPTGSDWVGFYPSSGTPDPGLVAWAYTGGAAAGSLNLTVPAGSPPGATYELRLYSNNSYTRLATSGPFTVT